MWVTPDTSVFLLTKRGLRNATGEFRRAQLYRIPPGAWHRNEVVVATQVDSLPIVPRPNASGTWITDAALSSADTSGTRHLAVRSYREVFVFDIDTVTWLPTTLRATCALSYLRERNSGEAVTWLADGRLMFAAEGEFSRIHAGRCP